MSTLSTGMDNPCKIRYTLSRNTMTMQVLMAAPEKMYGRQHWRFAVTILLSSEEVARQRLWRFISANGIREKYTKVCKEW